MAETTKTQGSGLNVVVLNRVKLEKRKFRARLSPGQYAIAMALVNREQKGICWLCHLPGIEELHHQCNDPTCRDITHFRGVHSKCNKKEANHARKNIASVKGERKKTRNLPVGSEPEGSEISWEGRRSLELGPAFDLESDRLLAEAGRPLTWKELENRLAKIVGCDQQTVTRFLERETTPEGRYETSERVVSDGRKKRTLQFVGIKRGK